MLELTVARDRLAQHLCIDGCDLDIADLVAETLSPLVEQCGRAPFQPVVGNVLLHELLKSAGKWRTAQIEWQYQALRSRAEKENRSISDLVRDILRQTLAQPPRGKGRLEEIEGIGEDQTAYGRAHDRFLYGGDEKD